MSNHTTLAGNLTREPELRYTTSGAAVVKFGIAVNRSFTNQAGDKVQATDFFDVTAWNELGENVAESLTVGARVVVVGRVQQDHWENDGGEKRSRIHIVAEGVGPSLKWATASVTRPPRHRRRSRRRRAKPIQRWPGRVRGSTRARPVLC